MGVLTTAVADDEFAGGGGLSSENGGTGRRTIAGVLQEMDTGVGAMLTAMGSSVAKLLLVSDVLAKSANSVHAAIAGTVAASTISTGLANPATPRNLRVIFASSWDGGDITAYGTDQFDAQISEAFVGASATTRTGTKVFKTITALVKSATGVNAASVTVGTGDKIGLTVDLADAVGMLMLAGVPEAVTLDATYNAFTPTTVPDGTVDYTLLVNVAL